VKSVFNALKFNRKPEAEPGAQPEQERVVGRVRSRSDQGTMPIGNLAYAPNATSSNGVAQSELH
jgi:hypothetical protein